MTPNPRRNRLIVSSKVTSAPESYTDTGPDFRWAVSVRMGSDESGGKLAGFQLNGMAPPIACTPSNGTATPATATTSIQPVPA